MSSHLDSHLRGQWSRIFQEYYEIDDPLLRCQANHIVTNLCTYKLCEADSALICDVEDCPHCIEHRNCDNVKLKAVTGLVKEKIIPQR